MAAGVAALLLSLGPTLTPDHVEEILRTSATDLGTAGWDQFFGWGLLNASEALETHRAAPRQRLMSLGLLSGLLVVATPSLAQFLPNGTFDTDIDSWTLEVFTLDPPGGGFELSWDATQGFPAPGSLRLSATEELGQQAGIHGWSPCFTVDPEQLPHLEARVKLNDAEGVGTCYPFIVSFDGPECTGERTGAGNIPGNEPGVWELRTWNSVLAGSPSYRVALILSYLSGTVTCNFDSVNLTLQGAGIAEVPAVGPPTLLMLGAFLLAGGLLVLRAASR
jgi:hypothetical protein